MNNISNPINNNNYQDNSKGTSLSWTQRPSKVNEAISRTFNHLASQSSSNWGFYNGMDKYYLCEIDEHILLKNMIQQARPERRKFYVLDIGAGNFSWSESLANFINSQTDINKDFKLTIIGVRGESYNGPEKEKIGKCTLKRFGRFKVEEISQEFKNRNINIENKVGIGVSHYCLHHLIDPVSTVAQIYDLLEPRSGLFLSNTFNYLIGDSPLEILSYHGINEMLNFSLFQRSKIPCLIKPAATIRGYSSFMIARPDEKPCDIKMSYKGMEYNEDLKFSLHIGSGCVTRFSIDEQEKNKRTAYYKHDTNILYGDKDLYERFKTMLEPAQWKDVYTKE